MKRSLYILLIAPLFLFSCKKEHGMSINKGPSAKRHAITVNVNNFTLKQTTFALRSRQTNLPTIPSGNSIANYVDQLGYVVLDTNFNPVKKIMQDSTTANMGTITDSLAAGTYYICIAAGKNGLEVVPSNFLGGYYDYSGNAWEDTFWASFKLIVGDQDLSRSVTLTRAVGKLEVQILDNIPANASSLSITVDGDASQKALLDSSFFTTVTTTFPVAIPASAIGKPNFTVDRLIGGISQAFNVTITCKDAGGNVINTVTAPNITCFANEKTILSGHLFTGINTGSVTQTFTAKVDTAWSSAINQISFSLRH